MSPAFVTEWLNLAVRMIHVIAAIMWIGSSLFFNWLDPRIEVNEETKKKGLEGELWMVHSGGFYDVQKTLVAPKVMPKRLHWFKWEAGFTLLSGWLLLDVVFFQGGGVTLVDPNVSSLSPAMATALVIGVLIGSWFVYDIFWRTPLAKNVYVGGTITYFFIIGVLWFFAHKVSGRAAFLLTGAMMGTWMATNVWVHIIPAQQGLVDAVTSGKPPSEHLAKHAKTRSRHNNYMTYPVVLAMLSNHFPGLYGHESNWLILAGLIVVAASIRHFQNTFKELSPVVLIVPLVVLLTLLHSSLTSTAPVTGATDPNVQLTATVPSNKGGPEKVANESTVGTIKGSVLLEGTPPPNKPINIGTCVSDGTGPTTTEAVLSTDGKLQNAFVWIKTGLDDYKGPAAPPEPVVMDQKACQYKPHVVGARVGQKVVFLNSDPVLHNVRSVADANSTFNDMMPTKDMRLEKVFEKTEVPVRAKCDVHPWMAAFIGVVPHPFFAVTGPDGSFTLANVPEGEYDIEAWHEVFGKQTAKAKVKAREGVTVTLTFKAE
ncbi:MAG: urate hydroxylase PuuD [Labilithrix sp.]|nr:urate hydroxylase PuuD [Labilithrix sp.]MCW5812249.1 urate hydroxylase PuuD [Labilithrix sp.]